MNKTITIGNMPTFNYWRMVAKQREERRLQALKRGENAPYGYWKDKGKPFVIPESQNNDVPPFDLLKLYKLEVTIDQANESLSEGEYPINLLYNSDGKWMLTYKNALKLPNNTPIKDVNGVWCIYKDKKFHKASKFYAMNRDICKLLGIVC